MPDDLKLSNPDNMFQLPSIDGPALPSFTSEFGTPSDSKDKSADDAKKSDAATTDEKDTSADSKDAPQKESLPSEPADDKKGEAAAATSGEPKK